MKGLHLCHFPECDDAMPSETRVDCGFSESPTFVTTTPLAPGWGLVRLWDSHVMILVCPRHVRDCLESGCVLIAKGASKG
jgi:hypothetical protein